MNVDEIIKTIKEKAGVADDVAKKASEVLDGMKLGSNKESVVAALKEKVGISEDVANKIYDAVFSVLSGQVIDKVKGLFVKK